MFVAVIKYYVQLGDEMTEDGLGGIRVIQGIAAKYIHKLIG